MNQPVEIRISHHARTPIEVDLVLIDERNEANRSWYYQNFWSRSTSFIIISTQKMQISCVFLQNLELSNVQQWGLFSKNDNTSFIEHRNDDEAYGNKYSTK